MVPRLVPVATASPASMRAASSATGSARTRTAASSMASGMPASRRQSLMTSGRSGSVSLNPLNAAAARCANSSTASPAAALTVAPESGPGTGSGPSLSTSSPGRCSGCLLVASTLMWLLSPRNALTKLAPARLPQPRLDEPGAGARQGLAGAEDKQQLPAAKLVEHRLEPASRARALQAEAQRDGIREQFGIGEAGQFDEAVAVRGHGIGGGAQCEAGLPYAAWPGDRD